MSISTKYLELLINTNPNGVKDFEFKRIKSLAYSTSCAQVPDQATITVPRCQVVNIPVIVSNVQWGTAFESPTLCFGTINTFEYRLPAGWSIGPNVSDGSNWIPGGSSVTVTSNASTGDGGAILIRPRNSCGLWPIQRANTRSNPHLPSASGALYNWR